MIIRAITMHRAKAKQPHHHKTLLLSLFSLLKQSIVLVGIFFAINSSSRFSLSASAESFERDVQTTTLCDAFGIAPLGMETGAIPDTAITASSSHDLQSVGPQNARLNREIQAGAWCPHNFINPFDSGREWIQVNLTNLFVITKIATQGRFGKGSGAEYTETFLVNYTRDGVNWINWVSVNNDPELDGNVDTNSTKENVLSNPLIGVQSIRLMPTSRYTRTSCLRFELFGCPYKNGPISYSVRYPDEGSFGFFVDNTYDGNVTDDGMLNGGMGQLVDGIEGSDDLRTNDGFEWVAWRFNKRLIIKFEFNEIQNFTNVRFHCHNLFLKNIQVFKAAKIWFSLDGHLWSRTPEDFEYMPDHVFEKARYIVIHLHNRIGKFIKFDFEFASQWLLLSEVRFDSKPLNRGLTLAELGFFLTETTQTQSIGTKLDGQLLFIVASAIVSLLAIFAFVIFLLTRKPKHNINESEYASVPVKDCQTLPYSEPHHLSRISPFSINEDPDYAVPDVIDTESELNAQNLLQWKQPQVNAYNFSNVSSNSLDDGKAKYYASIDVLSPPEMAKTHEQNEQNNFPYVNYKINPAALPCPPRSLTQTIFQSSLATDNEKSIDHGPMDDRMNNHFSPSPSKIIVSLENIALQNSIPILKAIKMDIIEGQFGYSKFGVCQLAVLNLMDKKTLVILKTLSKFHFKEEFSKEMIEKWRLSSRCQESFACFYGCITRHNFMAIAYEFGDMDLKRFLQTRSPSSVSFSDLMTIAYQISVAMQDIHSKGFIHRDLAARNCLIYLSNLRIKVTDSGAFMSVYKDEYYKEILPVRWMSVESIMKGEFTNKSDVYSFGVTLWEIMSLCQELPHAHLADEEIFEMLIKAKKNIETKNILNTTITFYNQPFNDVDGLSMKMLHLKKPINCPNDIYNLILKCCQLDDRCRPDFHDIAYLISKKMNL